MMIDADKGIGDDGRCRAGVVVNLRLIACALQGKNHALIGGGIRLLLSGRD
jgi:hypothetical protein